MSLSSDPVLIRPIEHRWIKANVVAALIAVAAALCIYALRQAAGSAEPGAGSAAVAIQYAAVVMLSGVAGAADGMLTGAVLQQIIPRLPVQMWVALRSAIAVTSGLVSEFALSIPTDDPVDPMSVFARIVMGTLFGAVLGAAAGTLEALVLRKAATGVKFWIEWSAIGYGVGIGLLGSAATYTASLSGFSEELINQVFGLPVSVTIAVMLIPALWQLRPRHLA